MTNTRYTFNTVNRALDAYIGEAARREFRAAQATCRRRILHATMTADEACVYMEDAMLRCGIPRHTLPDIDWTLPWNAAQ